MKIMRYYFIIALAFLTACQNESVQESGKTETNTKLDLVATSELTPPETISKIAFAPKPGFIAWTGHILTLTESGKIYTTNTAFGLFTEVSPGPFTDLQALSRGEDYAVFLALSPEGRVQSFIETDGLEFKALGISDNGEVFDGFCDMSEPHGYKIYAYKDELITPLTIGISDNIIAHVTTDTAITTTKFDDCFVSSSGEIYTIDEQGIVKGTQRVAESSITSAAILDPNANISSLIYTTADGTVAINAGETVYDITVGQGLSIQGIELADWVYSTPVSMGNTFSAGLTLIGEKDGSRIVMLANDYVLRAIETSKEPGDETETPTQ